jgi:hypothetical protein
MKRGVKKKDYEKLSDVNIRETMELLESGKPFTKKEACQKLNISYNTTRLNNIIAEYKDKVSFQEKRRSQNRGKPATAYEIAEAVVMYLNKEPISVIASSLFRSSSFVKGILDRVGVPEVPSKEEMSKVQQWKFPLIPEQMISTDFDNEEIVWSAKDCGLAKVLSELTHENVSGIPYKARIDYEKIYGSKAYNVYVLEKGDYSNTYFPHVTVGGHYSTSLAHDLGKLDHLIDAGIDLSRL